MTAPQTPTPVPTEAIEKMLNDEPVLIDEIKAETAPDPEDNEPTTVSDLALDIGFLVKQVAKDVGMPLGTAVSVVRTALDYHLGKESLAIQVAQTQGIPLGARPVALPTESKEEE